MNPTKLKVDHLTAYYSEKAAITDVSIEFPERAVSAIIGPSGCGKSTLIRCLNRMHETVVRTRVEGQVLLDSEDIYQLDPVRVRRRIGMVFQKPNPFVTMSIYNNVGAALRFNGRPSREETDRQVVRSLQQAALWEEVKDRIDAPAISLSGGQQQRLCIARALAAQPEVLLLDEPCSALDLISTATIEELIVTLRDSVAVVIVTHNLQQAFRVADNVAFMHLGELVEYGTREQVFDHPTRQRTRDYISGAFG